MAEDLDSLNQEVETNEDILRIKRDIFKVEQEILKLAKDAKQQSGDKRKATLKDIDNKKEEKKQLQSIINLEEDRLDIQEKEASLDYNIKAGKDKIAKIIKQKQKLESGNHKLSKDQVKVLKRQLLEQRANIEANITMAREMQGARELQEKMLGVLGMSRTAIVGMIESIKTMGVAIASNPILAIGAVLALAVVALKDMVEQTRQVGKELNVSLASARKINNELRNMTFSFGFFLEQFKLLKQGKFGEIADNMADAFKNMTLGVKKEDITGIMNEMKKIDGTIMDEQVAQRLAQQAATLNISGANMMKVANAFKLAGSGAETIEEAITQVQGLAVDLGALDEDSMKDINGIMEDIANNTESFAAYGKDGGANMVKAAASAKKLGLELGSMVKISDSLLDFESSIEKEMQASLMIGKQLNYDKARQLALEGDLAGAARNVVDQIGGQAEFNQMNVLQRRALAESIGVSVEEMNKLVGGGKLEVEQDPVIKSQEELKGSIDKLTEAMNKAIKEEVKELADTAAQVPTDIFASLKIGKNVANNMIADKGLASGTSNIPKPVKSVRDVLMNDVTKTKSGRFKVKGRAGPGFKSQDEAVKVAMEMAEEGLKMTDDIVKTTSKTAKVLNSTKSILKSTSRAATPIAAIVDTADLAMTVADDATTKQDVAKKAAEIAGGWAGAWAGAKLGTLTGAAIGSTGAGVMAVPGAIAGGIIGAIGGYFGGSTAAGTIADQADLGGTSELTAENVQSQINQEFRDLADGGLFESDRQGELLAQAEKQNMNMEQFLELLKRQTDAQEEEMKELIAIMTQVKEAGLLTNTSVQGLVNN